jgi:3',5'-cyclic AMP phosphodiesterase CpdA
MSLASEAVRTDFGGSPVVLLVSGDITTQGRSEGYIAALRSFTQVKELLHVDATMMLPGNHDIARVQPREFAEFNRFAFQATRDTDQYWNISHPVSVAEIGDYSVLLVNSAFGGDHRLGRVPLSNLHAALEATTARTQIVALHHSPISSQYAGGGLADAYEFLELISSFEVAAVLHGHVHSNQSLSIGPHRTLLFGVGSLAFTPDGNMNNQFAVHEFSSGRVVATHLYRYFRNSDCFERCS